MDRRDMAAAVASIVLAIALAYALNLFQTPHDLSETNPSPLALFGEWMFVAATNLAPPLALGALARSKVVLSAAFLVIATLTADTYFSPHPLFYPQLLGKLLEYMIQFIFMALGALYLKQGLSSNKSFKPNPLRSFKTPPDSSGGSA